MRPNYTSDATTIWGSCRKDHTVTRPCQHLGVRPKREVSMRRLWHALFGHRRWQASVSDGNGWWYTSVDCRCGNLVPMRYGPQ